MVDKTKQKSIFLASEGNSWFERNKSNLHGKINKPENDPVLAAIDYLSACPENVLEIGCSNGWRLSSLHQRYGAKCSGIDPASDAIADGNSRFPEVSLSQGTADAIVFPEASFDMVIFGFCLYLCDRHDLFKIACEVDTVLADGGLLVIYDFSTPVPIRNSYRFHQDIASFKMDYSKMFDWNPEYSSIYSVTCLHEGKQGYADLDSRVEVNVLKKNTQDAYLSNPYAEDK